MKLGVIIGYFYGKGLILCPNNKLRYFDICDEIIKEYRQKRGLHHDKKGNVYVSAYIDECRIASYTKDKDDKFKVFLQKIYRPEDIIKGTFSEELSYAIKHSEMNTVSYDARLIMKEITEYVCSLDIESILATYKIEEFKLTDPYKGKSGATTFGVRYTIQTEDAYIKSILPLMTKTDTRYYTAKTEDCYTKRLIEEEAKNLSLFNKRYSTINHINYLASKQINNDVNNIIDNEKKKQSILRVLSANYPVETIGRIINRRWPHMPPRMLCIKYNNEFDGTNFDIFGHKNSSKKRYYEKKARIAYRAWLKKREEDYGTWDPEQEVMNALMNGCGDYFGY